MNKVQATTGVDASGLAGSQGENTVAVNPTNPANLFVASAFGAGNNGAFAAFSLDGGATWNAVNGDSLGTGSAGDGLPEVNGGNVRSVFDKFGNLFLTYIAKSDAGIDEIAVVWSTDGGKTFKTLCEYPGSNSDQPHLSTGPGPTGETSSLLLSFTNDQPARQVYVAGAIVSGPGIAPVFGAPVAVPGGAGGLETDVAIGPTGQIAVSWAHLNVATDPDYGFVYVSVDPEGISNLSAAAFQQTPTVALNQPSLLGTFIAIPAQDERGISGVQPWIAFDNSNGPNRGRLYLLYSSSSKPLQGSTAPQANGAGVQDPNVVLKINLLYSNDNGKSFAPATGLVAGDGGDALIPNLAVDPVTGDVAVVWYGTNTPSDPVTRFYAAISGDGGSTFSPGVPVSVGSSNVAGQNAYQYGDYSDVAFYNGMIFPSWIDNSALLLGNPDLPNPDTAVARVAVAHARPAPIVVRGEAISTSEGQTFSNEVALFLDNDPSLTVGSFSADIDWGDGKPSTPGTITRSSNSGPYQVTGTHTYATSGAYPIVVTVRDIANGIVSNNASDASRTAVNENSTTVAADPTDPTRRFMASNKEGFAGLEVAFSTDGGSIWHARVIADDKDILPTAFGYPQAAFDQFGNLYLTYIDSTQKVIVVALSQDGGQTFTKLTAAASSDGVGPPAIATGPGAVAGTATVWIYGKDLGQDAFRPFAFSATGLGAVQPAGAGNVPSAGSRSFGSIAVGPAGQVLALVQKAGAIPGTDEIFTSLDSDGSGPAPFGALRLATSTRVAGFYAIPAEQTREITSQAALAWDRSTGPWAGRVYLVYTDVASGGGSNTNIFVRYSDDAGAHWSDPVQVNDDRGGASHFLPSIAIDQSTGNIAIGWYDTRNDATGVKTEFFTALSGDGGQTFSANVMVSRGQSNAADPQLHPFGRDFQYGNYTGMAFQQGIFSPAWSDNSAGLLDNPSSQQFDVSSGSFGAAQVADAPLTAKALDISADVNDAGEEFTADLASFTDADPNAPTDAKAAAALYTATIGWGDTTDPSPGTIKISGGVFVVSGTHAYEKEGAYKIKIKISDKGGASATVDNDADVEDGPLSAQGRELRPVVGQTFRGIVASFTDSDPNGQPDDYINSIDWGDGAQTTGFIRYSGTASLIYDPVTTTFTTVGNNPADNDRPYLLNISTSGVVTPIAPVGSEFYGGLALFGSALYAISNADSGVSTLNYFDATAGAFRPLFDLGAGFTGGLTFDASDGNLYAIADDGTTSTLYRVNTNSQSVTKVLDLAAVAQAAFSGLTYDRIDGFLYAIAGDSDASSSLYRITPGSTFTVQPEFVLGTGYTGGLTSVAGMGSSAAVSPFGDLVAISGDGSGSAVLDTIALGGATAPLFEIGANFDNGFDVVALAGAHTYAEKATFPVEVVLKDVGGSIATAHSSATVVNFSPRALTPPPAITVFQGFPSGPQDLARFTVPGGFATGPNAYSATIDWGEGLGNPADVGMVSIGSYLMVSGSHTYTAGGTFHVKVTLTDDTGNQATSYIDVVVAPDVSNQVRVLGLGGPRKPLTQLFDSTGSITNISGNAVPGSLYLVIQGLPAGVSLTNRDGFTVSGLPYVHINVSQLTPGQTLDSLVLEFSDPSLSPFNYTVTTISGLDGSAPGLHPSQQTGMLAVQQVVFHATEGSAFTGVTATFTDTDANTASSYTTTIDWGDGQTSAGTVAPNAFGGFDVIGTHTYGEFGTYAYAVTVTAPDGRIGNASGSNSTTPAGYVTYHVVVDTSALAGTAGYLDFQFNPGGLPNAQAADVSISGLVVTNGSLTGTLASDGDVSGSLAGSLILGNRTIVNEAMQGVTFGTTVSFDVRLSGLALVAPSSGAFGSLFALSLLGSDGTTALETTDPQGAIVRIAVKPNGSTSALPASGPPLAKLTLALPITVADAPLTASLTPIQPVEGIPFTGAVATFTDANPQSLPGDFTVIILWGDQTPASSGTVVADGPGKFHVIGTHTYAEAGSFPPEVRISDRGGSAVTAAAQSVVAPPGGFLAPLAATSDLRPDAYATGDLNGDGIIDLVVINNGSITPLLGNGDGTFRQTPTFVIRTGSISTFRGDLLLRDLTGDGKLDIVTMGAVFMGRGDGTFGPELDFDAGRAPVSLVVGDFNGDGISDVTMGSLNVAAGDPGADPGIRLLLGNGDGTFQSPVDFAPKLNGVFSVVGTDLNGDGKLDLAVTDASGTTSLIFGAGSGVFQSPITFAANFTVAAAGDLNADGKFDLVGIAGGQVKYLGSTLQTLGGEVQVWLGSGDGSFRNAASYPAGDNPINRGILLADFDGDGKLDLAVADAGQAVPPNSLFFLYANSGVTLLRGKGDGTFTEPVTYITGQGEYTQIVSALLFAADFNCDGRLDLAILRDRPVGMVSILLGNGNGTLVATRYSPADVSSNIGQNGVRRDFIATADFNGDGQTDVATLADSSVVDVLAGTGDGTFPAVTSIADSNLAIASLLLADLNNDGKNDVINGATVLLGNGDGTFRAAVSLGAYASNYSALAVGDFDGDGRVDVVINAGGTLSIQLGHGDGTFGALTTIDQDQAQGVDHASAVVGDFNGDGKLDLAETSDNAVFLAVLLGNGDGTFSKARCIPTLSQPRGSKILLPRILTAMASLTWWRLPDRP